MMTFRFAVLSCGLFWATACTSDHGETPAPAGNDASTATDSGTGSGGEETRGLDSGKQTGGLDSGQTGARGGDGNANGGRGGEGPASMRDAQAPVAGQTHSNDGGLCVVQVAEHATEGATHLAACVPVVYLTQPPSSGNHYGTWAAYGRYEFPLPRGFWVHNLEHGAVVITYNCPDGCAAELAEARAWFDALPVDPSCPAQVTVPRAILTPDPLLDVRWAASAWGQTLRAECFDKGAFSAFYSEHAGHGLENVCTSGADFRAPNGARSVELPADCGQ